MTKRIIETGNRLIAEFMTKEPEVLANDLKRAGTIEAMMYHKYWDWLIPVIIEIESIEENEDNRFEVVIRSDRCTIYCKENKVYEALLMEKVIGNKFLAIWKAVVTFIEWYNKDKLKKEKEQRWQF